MLAPKSNELVRLGDVAHIVAASDKGPRAPDRLTKAEREEHAHLIANRQDIANAVVLCSSCHKKADRLEETFTVRELVTAQAEDRARRFGEVGIDPVRRAGFGRLNTDDFGDDRDILRALIAAVGADSAADTFAHLYDDPSGLKDLSHRCDSDLASAKWQTFVYLARVADHFGLWEAAQVFWEQAASRAKLALVDHETIAMLLAQAASDVGRRGGDVAASPQLIEARSLAPNVPAVLLAGRSAPMPMHELAELSALAEAEPKWQAIWHLFRCLSCLHAQDLVGARSALRQIDGREIWFGRMATARLNIEVEAARHAGSVARPYDAGALQLAYTAARPVLDDLLSRNRALEAVGLRSLLSEALGFLDRLPASRALLQQATAEELETWDGRGALASAYIAAGERIRATQILADVAVPEGREFEARYLRVKANIAGDSLSKAQAEAAMAELESLALEDGWVGPASAAQMQRVAQLGSIDIPAVAETVLGEENAATMSLVRRTLAASEKDADWRAVLGIDVLNVWAVRAVLLAHLDRNAPITATAEVAQTLLTLDADARAHFLSADALLQQESTLADGIEAMLCVARDRGASASLRAEAYRVVLHQLRAADKDDRFLRIFDDELVPLREYAPIDEVNLVVNKWMATAGRIRRVSSERSGI